MVLSSIGSYLTTANYYAAHWADVDADRIANALAGLLLPGDYSLTDFLAERDGLQAALIAMEDLENAMQLAMGDRDAQKENVRARMRQFRAAGRLYFANSSYFRAMPTLPRMSTNESRFLKPLDDMANLWTRLNAESGIAGFTPPLLLTGGYPLAGFEADLTTLRANFMAVADADSGLDIARNQRDDLLESIREQMQKYRKAIDLEYGPGHPFYESLPPLTPAPGSTPEAVVLEGIWDALVNEALLTWTPSTNPNLHHYTIRMSPGPTFDFDNSTVISSPWASVNEFHTTAGLNVPGDVASYRVYVVLNTGNEAGSNAVAVTRM